MASIASARPRRSSGARSSTLRTVSPDATTVSLSKSGSWWTRSTMPPRMPSAVVASVSEASTITMTSVAVPGWPGMSSRPGGMATGVADAVLVGCRQPTRRRIGLTAGRWPDQERNGNHDHDDRPEGRRRCPSPLGHGRLRERSRAPRPPWSCYPPFLRCGCREPTGAAQPRARARSSSAAPRWRRHPAERTVSELTDAGELLTL